MDAFRTLIKVDALKPHNAEMLRACKLINENPSLQKNVEIAACILRIDAWKRWLFEDEVCYDLTVVKILMEHEMVPPQVLKDPAIIDYVFRENPGYVRHLPRGRLIRAFTPTLLEHVMEKIRTMVYSQKLLKDIPVIVRRTYAHHKIRERSSFLELVFENRTNLVSRLPVELKKEVAGFLGLVVSQRWLDVLHLVQRQIY